MKNDLWAGAGKAKINLDGILPIENFTEIYDDIYVRTLILKSNKQILLVSVEMTSLQENDVKELQSLVMQKAGYFSMIWIAATHTFSVPHIRNETLLDNEELRQKNRLLKTRIFEAALSAVKIAKENMQQASIHFGKGTCDININRDVETTSGWWIGMNPEGPADHDIYTLNVQGKGGKNIAILFNYAIQSSVLDGSVRSGGGKAVSSDVSGLAVKYVETCLPECVVLFFIGAAGDQVPKTVANFWLESEDKTMIQKDLGEQIDVHLEDMSKKLGTAVLESLKNSIQENEVQIKTYSGKINVPGKQMEKDRLKLKPTRNYQYISDSDKSISIELFTIGSYAFAGTMPELNCRTAEEIRRKLSYHQTWILTMLNGAAKYMADRNSYSRFTYEAMNSAYGEGAAETFVKEVVSRLDMLKNNS